ncbi:unnamed protein product [Rotaria sp. Silwood2]|nr:unnamed protein product [Rotaria sp. Silwood2]CAF2711660.1 unnamed protein product [Rotaria sp. Silwood2]
MVSANISASEIVAIDEIGIKFVSIWCYLMLILGLIGHTLNMCVFTRSSLRSNPCSCYFLAATVSGICVVTINIFLRLLQTVMNEFLHYQLTNFFSFGFHRALYAWFIVLTSIDRSSSASFRALSSLRVVYRTVPLTVVLVGLAYIHVLFYYRISIQQQACVPMTGVYQQFFGVWHLVAFSLVPPMLMLFFGLSTIRSIRQSIRRVGQNNIQIQIPRQQLRKSIDRQMIQMMLVQCIVFILTGSLPSINYLYTSLRSNVTIDALQSAKDNLLQRFTGFISLTVPCLSFYLFTLSSKLFRKELIKLFRGKWQPIHGTTTVISQSRRH